MPSASSADTIRVLVSTDNHVGYNERDPIRGDDSWKTFHEIMCLAKERDVDMVLLAGDLFHENKPSRKSMYQVMRSLRMNCYGEKPCELEMLSDASEQFAGNFNHVNYEDPDINVAIPVFSIHGNHDDPSGEGHLAALDILQMSGLVNYYGRTPESDNIQVKPVLLQKGSTKLALYGLSNVRDERLFRTFRDGNVKFFQPSTAQGEWFNLGSVHQNAHAYTETNYLPERFLPEFLDLVVWGHEHECKIEPRYNPETGFKVMQPGSSVATSLVEGETRQKNVAILSITGKEFEHELIRLKTVRPFVWKEVTLQDERAMKAVAMKSENQAAVNRFCKEQIDKLIEEAKQQWLEVQEERGHDEDDDLEPPLPLVRLRVEYTAPEGGNFQVDNPQRFSAKFVGQVANTNDVIQYHRRKAFTSRKNKKAAELPDEVKVADMDIDTVKIEALVQEFLAAQSLTILPQNQFGDAVVQYVEKDDKHAMEEFLTATLQNQVKQLVGGRKEDGEEGEEGEEDEDEDDEDEEDFKVRMEDVKSQMEQRFRAGENTTRKRNRRPKPDSWDSDMDGHWEDNVASIIRDEEDMDVDGEEVDDGTPSRTPAARGRGRGRGARAGGRAGAATGTTRKTPAPAKKAPAKAPAKGRGKKKADESEEEDEDVVMISDDHDSDDALPANGNEDYKDDERRSPGLFMTQESAPSRKAPPRKTTTAKAPAKAPARSTAKKPPVGQSQLNFGSQVAATGSGARGRGKAPAMRRMQEPSEDEISDDDDAFEPAPVASRRR